MKSSRFPRLIVLAMLAAGAGALILAILRGDWVLAMVGAALGALGWLWAALIVGAHSDDGGKW